MKVRILDNKLSDDITEALQSITKEYIQSKESELDENQKRSLKKQLGKVHESFNKHLKGNVVAVRKEEAKLYTQIEEEPLDQELMKNVKAMENEVRQTAQRIFDFRKNMPEKMQAALLRQNLDLESIQSIEKTLSQKNTVENKENVQLSVQLEEFYHEVKEYSNTLKEMKRLSKDIPQAVKKIKDAQSALKSITSNQNYLKRTREETNQTEGPSHKKRK
ncbi:SLC9A4 [Acrasis kona]|uniref:SLC9A4 n=1 Tax=Acrasis kona TaxID=1008807 RepID=A0AAW2ZFM1_9EUKA